MKQTIIGTIIKSWLPSEDSDTHYPQKRVVLIEVGEKGYCQTDWFWSKEMIIDDNNLFGITEEERQEQEAIAMRKPSGLCDHHNPNVFAGE